MTAKSLRGLAAAFALAFAGLAGTSTAQAAATILIVKQEAPGRGFHDPRPAAPGGEPRGTARRQGHGSTTRTQGPLLPEGPV